MSRRDDCKPLTSRNAGNGLSRDEVYIANNGSPTTPLQKSTKF